MPISRRNIRQRVGQELGILYPGTSTSTPVGDLTLIDTSGDSPMDPGDVAQRFNGAGLLVSDATDLFYRQNVTYTPATQQIAWTGAIVLVDAVVYEIHTEPLLHPLLIWPRLIDDALALIRRISFQHILLNNRSYYDLTDWADVTGVEQVRRVYDMGPNFLQNPDFADWITANNGPNRWTASAALDRTHQRNVPQGATLNTGETLDQAPTVGLQGRRLLASVWATTAAGATATLRVTARLADGSTEREVTVTLAASLTDQIEVEIETTPRTNNVRFRLEASGGNVTFWAPMFYEISKGYRRRIKSTTVQADGTIRLYLPHRTSCGQMMLLLPYTGLGSTTTEAADVATTAAPDNLIIAATAVQVLSWLVQNPQIVDKQEYAASLQLWQDRFNNRAREHMRRVAKTQSLWEVGEVV